MTPPLLWTDGIAVNGSARCLDRSHEVPNVSPPRVPSPSPRSASSAAPAEKRRGSPGTSPESPVVQPGEIERKRQGVGAEGADEHEGQYGQDGAAEAARDHQVATCSRQSFNGPGSFRRPRERPVLLGSILRPTLAPARQPCCSPRFAER